MVDCDREVVVEKDARLLMTAEDSLLVESFLAATVKNIIMRIYLLFVE